MTFKEKVFAMNYLFSIYPKDYEIELIKKLDLNNTKRRYFELMNSTMKTLPYEERKIIKAEFVDHLDDGWWIKDYSRSKYYRLKGQAMQRFLDSVKR